MGLCPGLTKIIYCCDGGYQEMDIVATSKCFCLWEKESKREKRQMALFQVLSPLAPAAWHAELSCSHTAQTHFTITTGVDLSHSILSNVGSGRGRPTVAGRFFFLLAHTNVSGKKSASWPVDEALSIERRFLLRRKDAAVKPSVMNKKNLLQHDPIWMITKKKT